MAKNATKSAAAAAAPVTAPVAAATPAPAPAPVAAPAASSAPVIATVTIAPAAPAAPKQRGRPKKADGAPAVSSFVDVSLTDLETLVGKGGFVRVSRTWLKSRNVTITPIAAPAVAAADGAADSDAGAATPFPVS